MITKEGVQPSVHFHFIVLNELRIIYKRPNAIIFADDVPPPPSSPLTKDFSFLLKIAFPNPVKRGPEQGETLPAAITTFFTQLV